MPSLEANILEEVAAAGGAIPFRRFMELALYHPRHGYYARGQSHIGRGGDFITSVCIGPLFGRLMAAEFEAIWREMGRPEGFTLVEQGAERGTFLYDVLSATAREWPAFHEALRATVVEPFRVNRFHQEEMLEPWQGKVAWVDSLEALPRFTGVHFSNELPDAFPIHAVTFRNGQWQERMITAEGSKLGWTTGPLSHPALLPFLENLSVPEGYETEVNLAALEWMDTLAGKLERGVILLADYGFPHHDYYLPERHEGTLTAYYHHRRQPDLLARPGLQDLTAHVEFTTLAEKAESAGLALLGYTDQHHLMVALGQRLFPDATAPLTPGEQKERRAFASLMHPGLLGRGFHYLALGRGWPTGGTFPGFEFAGNARRSLGL